MKFCFVLAYVLIICSFATKIVAVRVVCYFQTGQKDHSLFSAANINANLCTHVVYRYAILDLEYYTIERKDSSNFFDHKKEFQKTVALTKTNPQLKVIISLKPTKFSDKAYSRLAEDSINLTFLVKQIVTFLEKYSFHGIELELDEEWTQNKVKFVVAFRKIFNNNTYSFSVIAGECSRCIDQHDIPLLSQNVDFLSLLTDSYYDPDGERNHDRAYHHAPLYGQPLNYSDQYNVNFTVNDWISKGFQRDKIVISIPLFGTSWTLSSNQTTPPAPAKGPGSRETISDRKGFMYYFEICYSVQKRNWQSFQDPRLITGPYAVSPQDLETRTWVGYDDPAMAIVKANYILSSGLGGAAVWDVNSDDTDNICNGGPNPMMTAIWNTLKSSSTQTDPAKLTYGRIKQMPSVNASTISGSNTFRCQFAFALSLLVSIGYVLTLLYIFLFVSRQKKVQQSNPDLAIYSTIDDL